MAQADAVRAVGRLVGAFAKETIKDATVNIYVDHLSDIDGPLLQAAVTDCITKLKFFPAISEIRHAAARISGPPQLSQAEVIAIIRQADVREPVMRRDGSFTGDYDRYWRWPENLDESVIDQLRDTLAVVGEPCDADGKPYFGWELGFSKTFEAKAEKAMTELVTGDMSHLRLPAPKLGLIEGGKP